MTVVIFQKGRCTHELFGEPFDSKRGKVLFHLLDRDRTEGQVKLLDYCAAFHRSEILGHRINSTGFLLTMIDTFNESNIGLLSVAIDAKLNGGKIRPIDSQQGCEVRLIVANA